MSDGELGFSALVFSDLARYREGPGSWLRVLLRCASEPGMIASILIRTQQCLFRRGKVRLAWLIRTIGVLTVGAEFVPGMRIGPGLMLPHPVGIVIGNEITIGANVTIGQGVTIGARIPNATVAQGWPTICDGAFVLARSTIVGAVTVGRHAQVGANSLVVADVPDYAVVLGVPARKIASRESDVPGDA